MRWIETARHPLHDPTVKVLVTGGAGFIGSHTTKALIAAGAYVRVLDNFSTGRRESLPQHERLQVLEGDIREVGTVEAALVGVSHVLHLAAQVSVQASMADPVESMRHNVYGFVGLLDGARRAGVRRFVYASSAAVYGHASMGAVSETSPTLPLSPYALEKLVNEQYCTLYEKTFGFSALGLRYFNVYGPGQDARSPYSGVVSIFADGLRQNEPLTVFGDGRQTRDFIYVGDIAQANVAALCSDVTGVCNVATGASVQIMDLIRTFGFVTGQEPAVHFAPPRGGDILHSSAVNDRLRRELEISAFTTLENGLQLFWESLQ
jgi:UDP-glucose 4-epimerase